MGLGPRSVAVGDFNNDGKVDIAVGNSASNNVSVLLNATVVGATMPLFAAQNTFAVGSVPFSVAVGDFDGDGEADLVVANSGGNDISCC